MIKMAGSNPTESESGGKRGAHTPMSKPRTTSTQILRLDIGYSDAAF